MVERILKQAQAIRHVLSDDRRSSLSLTWQDMDILKAVHEVRKYLCVCATSTPSERVFSTAGKVVGPQRALLKPDKVNMLVFLAKNLD